MRKQLIILMIYTSIGTLVYGSSKLPIYRVKNKTKNMVDFAFVVSYPLSVELRAEGGIQPRVEVPDIFEKIRNAKRLVPIETMIVDIVATFYENQYTYQGSTTGVDTYSSGADTFNGPRPVSSYSLGSAVFRGPLPSHNATFILMGPDGDGNYSIEMQPR